MNLSIVVLTAGNPYARRCLNDARERAGVLGAELVVGGDGDAGMVLAEAYADRAVRVQVVGGLGESVIPELANACRNDWVLRFDDDETGSAALWDWIAVGEWEHAGHDLFHFPRAWLWGDDRHFITNAPLWTDKQARLTRREVLGRWDHRVHAGAPAGRGADVPAALVHHKFLVRTFAERQETARLYDALDPGAGSGEYFGKFTLPELFFVNGVTVRELGDGAVRLDGWNETGERVPCSRKIGADSMPIGKGAWNPALGNRVGA